MLEDDELQQLIVERLDEDASFWTGTGRNRTAINVEVSDGSQPPMRLDLCLG